MTRVVCENIKDYFETLDQNTQENLKEYFRVKQRLLRHGENVVLKRGRPKVSESHKKRRRAAYLEKIRQQKKEDGTYRPRGRPRKKIE
jgi:hypothetical protein